MSHSTVLHSAQQGHQTLQSLWTWAKPRLLQGERLQLTVKPATRSLAQNDKLHAELTEIARVVPWAGKKRDVEVWKRLMVAAWLRARGESVEILPALDGHGVDVVFRRTSDLTRAECSELLEFVMSWKAENVPT